MNYVKSCGFIPYVRKDNENFYLLIKSINGDVGFPKGHMESGESELETAIRELKEETNLEVKLISGFRCQIEYKLPRLNDTVKQSVYFLGECLTEEVVCQKTEVSEANFLPYEDALELLTFEDTKKILREAEAFLDSLLENRADNL